MGGRRACLPLCAPAAAVGRGTSSSSSSSSVLGYGLCTFFPLKQHKMTTNPAKPHRLSGCVHLQPHAKGGEMLPFAIIPPSEGRGECFKRYRSRLFTSSEVPPPGGGGSGNELPHKSTEKCRQGTGVPQR